MQVIGGQPLTLSALRPSREMVTEDYLTSRKHPQIPGIAPQKTHRSIGVKEEEAKEERSPCLWSKNQSSQECCETRKRAVA